MKSKSLKGFILASTVLATSVSTVSAVSYFDSASDSAYADGWVTGDNGGSGFGPWTIASSNGASGFGGAFIGDPADAGITGMSSTSFGLYANPTGSGAYVNADRSFANPLGTGDSFSFQWSINWDSGSGGNKGFNLYSGGTQLININNAGSSVITINDTDIGFGFGDTAMTWAITRTSATNLRVDASNRDGGKSYFGNFTISGDPNAFRFYASNMQARDQAQPYFNNLAIIPEPSSLSLLTLSGLALLRRRRA